MTIRTAEVGDYAKIAEMLEYMCRLHAEGRPDIFAAGAAKYDCGKLSAICADPDTPVYVADEGGRLCGYCMCRFLMRGDKSEVTRPYFSLWVDDLCVLPECRRMGVASALMEHVRACAAERGCHNIELNVWDFNSGAVDFYEDFGFSVQRRIMELRL